jgi:uncharacterized membrane protein YccC
MGVWIMKKMPLIIGMILLLLAIMVFVFADGLRRWYSGAFFAIIGIVSILNSLNWKARAKK